MKLWLDDIRLPPTNEYWWAKSVEDAIYILKSVNVTHASLDHDLGEGVQTGYDLCNWMERNNIWPLESCVVHSMNPVGRMQMQVVIDRHYMAGGRDV